MRTITKEEFITAKQNAPIDQVIREGIGYKKSIQVQIMLHLTTSEEDDIRYSRLNEDVIDKMCQLGAWQPNATSNPVSLYACAMAIATIIKEYEWGLEYLSEDGLYNLAERILRKAPINF